MENSENLEPIGELKLAQPNYLFTINDNADKLIEIDKTGNITYIKNQEALTEASRVFWNSLQGNFIVIEKSLVDDNPNDMELGKAVRKVYYQKMDSQKTL